MLAFCFVAKASAYALLFPTPLPYDSRSLVMDWRSLSEGATRSGHNSSRINTYEPSLSVDSKRVMDILTPLNATLTKNRDGGTLCDCRKGDPAQFAVSVKSQLLALNS
jgi:hypothetical protein